MGKALTPEQWQRVFALVKASLERDRSERASFLVQNCGNDDEVRSAAQSLLLAQEQMGSFLEQPSSPLHFPIEGESTVVAAPASSAKPPQALPCGATVGRYVVLNLLGTGGMGVVYAAYDPELDRKLALKLLHPEVSNSLLGSGGRARLLREAQAMARLSHTNVIAVHDVGTLGDEVFIAMEYVDGCTLKTWLKAKRPWPEIVAMFVQAGRGLSAAHSAGIVHRDFKPDNVLVGKDGRARVLDFGLARGAIPAETAQTVRLVTDEPSAQSIGPKPLSDAITQAGALIGTPAYMAPEQMAGGQVDARTDQFSFCAALYQALFGELPFEGDTLSQRLAAIRDGRLRSPKASNVPGWLRDVVLKGLRAEPDARYPSMEVLLHKLEQNRAKVWRRVTAVAFMVLLVTLAPWVSYRIIAHRQSLLCRGAQDKLVGIWDAPRSQTITDGFLATGRPFAKDAARMVAQTLDAYAQSWITIHTQICEATRLRGEQSEELLDLRMDCLDQRRKGLKALVDVFATPDAKLVEKSVQAALSLEPLESCASATLLKSPIRAPADPAIRGRVDQLRNEIAQTAALEEAGKYSEGLQRAKAAAAEAKALHYAPAEADALLLLGKLKARLSDYKSAEETLQEALIAAEAGRSTETAARAWTTLVVVDTELVRYEQAHQSARHAFATIEGLGGNERRLGALLDALGYLLRTEGKYEEQAEQHRRAADIHERLLGPSHPFLALSLSNLGVALGQQGKYDEALAVNRRVLEIRERALGLEHPDYATTLHNIGTLLRLQGHNNEALTYFNRALAIRERTLGSQSPEVAQTLTNLGLLSDSVGQYDQALLYHRRALAIKKALLPPTHPLIAISLHNIGDTLLHKGDYTSALENFQRALAIQEKALDNKHPEPAFPLTGIGRCYLALRMPAKAIMPLERALALRESRSVDATDLAETRFALARALKEVGAAPKRAIILAQQARGAYADAGNRTKSELAEVDAWLAAAAPGPPHLSRTDLAPAR